MAEKIKKFKVTQCKSCGHYQIMGGLNFKCKICNKSTKIKLKSKYGLNLNIIDSFDTGLEAQKFLSNYCKEIVKDNFLGFKSFEAKTMAVHLVGLCYYCRESVYSDESEIFEDKPFHKQCIQKYKKASIITEDVE